LLGDAVRYDGQSKANTIILHELSKLFEFLPVCPEVEAGLSIPRPPVQLTGSLSNPRMTGRDDPSLDITSLMQDYCRTKMASLSGLQGFISKSHSPSCGLNSTPVYVSDEINNHINAHKNNQPVTQTARGIFAKSICTTFPTLPVIEDNELDDPIRINAFILAVGQ